MRSAPALVLALLLGAASAWACSSSSAPDAPVDPGSAGMDAAVAADAPAEDGAVILDAGAPDVSGFHDDAGIWHLPDPSKTPGALCTATDPNFAEFRYAEHVAICNRNVPTSERDAIGAAYGIPRADFANYEFDHFIPLSIGGSDAPQNLWPQPRTEALRKDTVEQKVFDGMNNGTMTQAQAIALIRAWRP